MSDDFREKVFYLDALEQKVIAYMLYLFAESKGKVIFLQVGAHDGKSYDPLHDFIAAYGWKGASIEPVPELFQALVENRSKFSGMHFFQACCLDEVGPRAFFQIQPGPDEYSSYLSSFDLEVILKHSQVVPLLSARIKQLGVEILTVDQIVRKSGFDRVDLIFVDAEGVDDRVLYSYSSGLIEPDLVCFEHKHLSKERLDKLTQTFIARGYQLASLLNDSFFVSERLRKLEAVRRLIAGILEIFPIA